MKSSPSAEHFLCILTRAGHRGILTLLSTTDVLGSSPSILILHCLILEFITVIQIGYVVDSKWSFG